MSPARTTDLSRAFRPVLSRKSGVAVALWGEPGSGKSHTAGEFLRALPCRTVSLAGTSTSIDLHRALGAAHSDTERGEPATASPGDGYPADPNTLAETLASLAPVVVLVDDVPLEAIRDQGWLIALAAAVPGSQGVGLLITTRGRVGRPFRPMRLEPLTRAAICDLLQEGTSSPLPDAAVDWIHDAAAGNPLFARECLRHLTRHGFLWSDGHRWYWRPPDGDLVPPTVEALVDQAVADVVTLPTVENVGRACALVPPGVSPADLAAVSGVPQAEVETALAALEAGGVYVAGDFVHPAFRRHLVRSVGGEERNQLASRAVRAFRNRPLAAAAFLADVSDQAVDGLEILVAAADQAADPAMAGRYLARAASYASGEPQGELALRAARLLRYLDPNQATRLAELSWDLLPSSTEAALMLAEMRALRGDLEAAERAVQRLEGPERSRALVRLWAMAGEHERVLELWRGSGGGWRDPDLLALVAAAMLAVGDDDGAERVAAPLLSRASGEVRCRLMTVLGRVRHRQGRVLEAAELLTRCVESRDLVGPSRDLAAALENRAEVWQSLGRLDRKRADISEAIAIYESLADPRSVAATRVKLGVLLLEEGEHAAAEDALQASRATLERLGASLELVECERMLCYLYRQLTLPFGAALARKYANSALARARALGNAYQIANVLYEAAYAESLAGNPRTGLSLAEECIVASESLSSRQTKVYGLFARAYAWEKLGDLERAKADLERAAADATSLGLEMDAQTIGLELDRLAGARETAQERRRWFEARGQARRARMVDEYFPATRPGSPTERAGASFRIELLGPARLLGPAGVVPIRGRKRQRLLALLLEARVTGRKDASRTALIDELYPTKDEQRAASNLKELVHGLRTSLTADLVRTTVSGYALGDCTSDVEEFLATLDTGLWRGHYQAGSELGLAPVSESLYMSLREGAEHVLDARPAEAARAGRLLVEADPYDRRALRVYLMALRRLSNHRTLVRHYQVARSHLAEVGERLPERWQEFLEEAAAIGR